MAFFSVSRKKILYFTEWEAKTTAKDSIQGHRQKGEGQSWMSQGLALGLGIRKQ